jgi:DNA repair exonuclease SbcCD ATPase subunit
MCIRDRTGPKEVEKTELESQVPGLDSQIAAMDGMIGMAQKTITDNKPDIDLALAKSEMTHRSNLELQIVATNSEIEQIKAESPPNVKAMGELKETLVRIKEEILGHQQKSKELEERIIHLEYIRKAYSDRSKVKKDVISGHVPFINERLRYYLDIMDLDVRVQLTDSLGIESNYWGYDFQSNGEKRRTDVAMMFATFDLHEQLYGRQCNILALDEVDGQMDPQGIDALIHIIKNDLSRRAGSIFVISHMNTMQSVFGSEIRVRKRGKLSYLEQ